MTPLLRHQRTARAHELLAGVAVLLVCQGCGNAAKSQLRTSSPAEAAAAVMVLYDANKDGKVDDKELEASPALVDGLPRIDKNRDHAIDAAEMQARFEAHDKMSDVVGFDVSVTAKGRLVIGADVTFIPEPFMGEGKQSYVGRTNKGGAAHVHGQNVELVGVPTGYYTVRLVHEGSKLDVKRGCEVADDTPSPNGLQFDFYIAKVQQSGR